MRRRRFLALAGAGVGATAGGVAVNNVLLGYGRVSGTNLREQELTPLVDASFGPVVGRTFRVGDAAVRIAADAFVVTPVAADHAAGLAAAASRHVRLSRDAAAQDAAAIERKLALPAGSLQAVQRDLQAIAAGEHNFSFVPYEAFADRLAALEVRPWTVDALRGPRFRRVDPAVVAAFADTQPERTGALIAGLVEGFRRHTTYDVPRYLAGAAQGNLLGDRVNLRGRFDRTNDFPTLLEDGTHRLFCWEYAARSIEALHAVPAADQSLPVVCANVRDPRHQHVYTGLASVARDAGRLEVVMTFIDYTKTTLVDDAHLTGLVEIDVNAYDRNHRAEYVRWNWYRPD